MIEEVAFFLRYGPNVGRKQTSMGKVEFQNWLTTRVDEDGMAAPRAALVEGLHGEVVEIGCGSGAMFQYYSRDVRVTAIEPDDEFRESAEQAAYDTVAKIRVIPGFAESLTMPDDSVDAIVCSTVLCSVDSISKTLAEFKRVLKPGGSLRLFEHVRSEHWMAGPLMSLTNRLWLRINKVGCNWNRHIEEPVRGAGFRLVTVERIKFYSTAAPATFPYLLIKAEK